MTLDDLAAQVERCWLDHGHEDDAHDCGHDNFQECVGAAWKVLRELRAPLPTFSEREAIRLLVAAKQRKDAGQEDAEYHRLKDEGWRVAFEVEERRKAAIAARPIANAGDLLERLVGHARARMAAEIDRTLLAGIAAAEKEDAAAAEKAKDVTGLRFCTNDYCGGHTRAPWSCP